MNNDNNNNINNNDYDNSNSIINHYDDNNDNVNDNSQYNIYLSSIRRTHTLSVFYSFTVLLRHI